MDKDNCYLRDVGFKQFEVVVDMLCGKWKLRIIYMLALNEVLRYGELKRLLSPITHKMLSSQLKELESDKLIVRKEYPEIPPKVEYYLTDKAKDLEPIVQEMNGWIKKHNIVK